MFTDPITITVNGVAKTLSKISSEGTSSTYATPDEEYLYKISHQVTNAGRVRSTLELTQKKVVTNPLDSTNDYDTVLFRYLIDRPLFGWSATELDYVKAGLAAWLTTANLTKLFGKES